MRIQPVPFLFCVLFFCFHQSFLFGQDTSNVYGKVSIASPTAASLGKYGDIPVSYNTGIPNISIPIYTVTSGYLKLPISLSYHASGLKVQEQAGWVGAGWSLNAGGVITRTVVGGPDEAGTNNGGTEIRGHFSHYGYNNYMNLTNRVGGNDWESFVIGAADGEPDLFFFNFNGYSGKFFFRDDRTPIMLPEEDFKIIPYYTQGSGQSIQGFIITTPDGTQYSFGNTPGSTGTSATEVSIPINISTGSYTPSTISSWYLTKISSKDQLFNINLSYTPESYGYFTYSMQPLPGPTTLATAAPLGALNNVTPGGGLGGSIGKYEYDLVKNVINGVRLSSIFYADGSAGNSTISFLPGGTPNGLPRIDLSDNSKQLYDNTNAVTSSNPNPAYSLGQIQINTSTACKEFSFSYSYFSDPSPTTGYFSDAIHFPYNLHSDQNLLRLDSIKETSCDNSLKVPSFKFNYYSELVPRRLSFGIDHWGYYNGADATNNVTKNITLIPAYTINNGSSLITFPGANRDAVWPAMRGGALQRITYPTGGSTTFNFENYNYTSTGSVVQQVYILGGTLLNPDNHSVIMASYPLTVTASQLGNFTLTANNYVQQANPILTITNSKGVVVYNNPVIYNQSTNATLSAIPETYTFTIAFKPTDTNGFSKLPYSAPLVNFSLTQTQNVNVTTTIPVGGLRINSIIENDGTGVNNQTKQFTYTSPILLSYPVYVNLIRNDLIKNIGIYSVNLGFQPGLGTTSEGCVSLPNAGYMKSASSLRPMGSLQGYHIGYTGVKVSESGNGYSLYNYYGPSYNINNIQAPAADVAIRTLYTLGCLNTAPNYPAAPLNYDFLQGELFYEAHYTNSGQIIKDATYFPIYTQDSIGTPAFKISVAQGYYLGTFYTLYSSSKTKMTTIENTYSGGINPVTTTKIVNYGSRYHHQATSTLVTTSRGDTLKTKALYAQDFRIPSCDALPNGIIQYAADTVAALNTYATTVKGCANNSNFSACATNALLAFQTAKYAARAKFAAYQAATFTNLPVNGQPESTFQKLHDAAKASADTLLRPVLELQDEYHNPEIEVTSWRGSNLLHANFTRFDTTSTSSGYVYPKWTEKVYLNSPSSIFTPYSVIGNTLFGDPRYSLAFIYKFLGGNLASTNKLHGPKTSYVWGYGSPTASLGTGALLPIAKVENASANQIAYTSFENGSPGNWTYPTSGVQNLNGNSKTGINVFNFAFATGGSSITSSTLPAGTYIVSYWGNQSAAVNGNTALPLDTVTIPTLWAYFSHTVTLTSPGSITVTAGGQLDELRLYPQGSMMTTYTYNPGTGMTSQTDVKNETTYYQYDGLQRLSNIVDHNGNIQKHTDYHYQGQ